MNFIENICNYVKKHADFIAIASLILLCYFVFFFNLGNYALMDVDETRYVSMARDMFNTKDFLTLYLNGEYFFEKPPLYFWFECLSFAIFGHVNEFSARFPAALCGTLSVLLMYFAGRKIISARYGFISAIILATTLEFVILAKFAILDILLATCVGFSVISGFLTQFVKDKNKKYCWWLFYIFSGLAVMAKGIPGFVIPFGTMFFISIFNKSFKKIFKPEYIITGMLLFLIIVLPWHIIMLKSYNPLFFNEYIMKHHINRFFSSSEIHRAQPFYFYFLMLLWGLIPYIFSAIAVLITKIKNFGKISFENLSKSQKFLWFNIIASAFIILFLSLSSTKLITYILPIYYFTSFIFAYIWEDYIFNDKYKKAINISVYIVGAICIFAAVAGCFMKYYLPENVYINIKTIQQFCVVFLAIFGYLSIWFVKKENFKGVFVSYALLITLISAFGTKLFFNYDYLLGQYELIQYANYCKDKNLQPSVINDGRKYSVLYYYGNNVNYITILPDTKNLSEQEHALLNDNSIAIVKKKNIGIITSKYNFETVKEGRKYKIIKINSLNYKN